MATLSGRSHFTGLQENSDHAPKIFHSKQSCFSTLRGLFTAVIKAKTILQNQVALLHTDLVITVVAAEALFGKWERLFS